MCVKSEVILLLVITGGKRMGYLGPINVTNFQKKRVLNFFIFVSLLGGVKGTIFLLLIALNLANFKFKVVEIAVICCEIAVFKTYIFIIFRSTVENCNNFWSYFMTWGLKKLMEMSIWIILDIWKSIRGFIKKIRPE